MSISFKSLFWSISLLLALAASVSAAPGDLDTTFANGGIVITNGGASLQLYTAWAMAIQSDGKIVVVGEGAKPPFDNYNWDFTVVRYNPDGSLDTSFGGTGIVLTEMGGNLDQATSVAIQADGKIVVAGNHFAVVRYNTDGTLDTSFNGTGKVSTSVGSFGGADSVAIQSDGKIVVAGISGNGSTSGFALVRYNSDGSLDTTFNGTGKVFTPGGGATSVAIQFDGKIVAAGGSGNGSASGFALVRYNPDGTLDTSFNGAGKVITPIGNSGSGAGDLAIQTDGKIVAAGYSLDAPNDLRNSSFALVRYNPEGSLDTSFGGTGKIVIPDSDLDFAYSVAIQPNSKIVVAGSRSNIGYSDKSAVVRLNPNGTLDTSFNGTGKVTTTFSGAYDHATAVEIQTDGKIVVAGDTGPDEFKDFVVVRYQGDGATATPTPTPTPVPTPTPSPTLRVNGKIAFTSDRDGNREIYVMNADGTNQVRLTNNSVVDDHPTWSPDGTKIAFVSQRSTGGFALFFMNADGTNKTEITPINFDTRFPIWDYWSMSWSPDGNRIVFQENNDIFIVNKDGSNQHVLVNDSVDERQPAWSPDGSKILFSKQDSPFLHNLYTVKPDGTGLHPLAYFVGETDLAPTWSPTGDMIAFQMWDYANFESILIASADGSGRDYFDSGSVGPDYGGRDKPQWSPDGTKIIFHVSRENIGTEIYVKNVNGTGLVQLTNTPGSNYKPSWQPLAPAACPNPIDCADFFVRQHYRDFLDREPEPGGLAAWLSVLNNCAAGDLVCQHQQRLTTSAAFFGSPEFQLKGYFVFRFYRTAFARLPDYSEISADMRSVTGPTTEDVYARKSAFTNSFVQRSEFVTLLNGLPNADYVAALLGRYNLTSIITPDPEQPDSDVKMTLTQSQLVNRLDAGTLTRAQVLRAIADSDQVLQAEFNRAFVAMQYYGYLRRTPETTGYNSWLNYLNAHPQDFREMVRGFVDSIEYRMRFGQP